jgi:hypothetical protein
MMQPVCPKLVIELLKPVKLMKNLRTISNIPLLIISGLLFRSCENLWNHCVDGSH